jgi:hypothetical protein
MVVTRDVQKVRLLVPTVLGARATRKAGVDVHIHFMSGWLGFLSDFLLGI